MVDFIAVCIYDKTLLIVTYLGCAYAVTRLTFVHVILHRRGRAMSHNQQLMTVCSKECNGSAELVIED